jgi:hypothetical protein
VNCHREPCPVSRKSLAGCPDQRECRWLAIRCRVVQESYVHSSKRKIKGTTSLRFPARHCHTAIPRMRQRGFEWALNGYGLMTAQYGEMNASFIRVLNLQRMLYENETGYIDALEHSWTSSVALNGFLLEGGPMAPDSMELDMPTSGIERMESTDRTSRMFDSPDFQ